MREIEIYEREGERERGREREREEYEERVVREREREEYEEHVWSGKGIREGLRRGNDVEDERK